MLEGERAMLNEIYALRAQKIRAMERPDIVILTEDALKQVRVEMRDSAHTIYDDPRGPKYEVFGMEVVVARNPGAPAVRVASL